MLPIQDPPEIEKQESNGDKQETYSRVLRSSANPKAIHLAITRFNPKPRAIFAPQPLQGTTPGSPQHCKQMDFMTMLAVSPIQIGTNHIQGHRHAAILWRPHGVAGLIASLGGVNNLFQCLASSWDWHNALKRFVFDTTGDSLHF